MVDTEPKKRQEYQLFTGVISAADSRPNCSLKIDEEFSTAFFYSAALVVSTEMVAFIIHSVNQSVD